MGAAAAQPERVEAERPVVVRARCDGHERALSASVQRGARGDQRLVTVEPLLIDIERVAHGGVCIGHADDGRVVFVRHTLPGERVRAHITEERRSYLRADAVEVVRASPARVTPPCPWAGPGRCGAQRGDPRRPPARTDGGRRGRDGAGRDPRRPVLHLLAPRAGGDAAGTVRGARGGRQPAPAAVVLLAAAAMATRRARSVPDRARTAHRVRSARVPCAFRSEGQTPISPIPGSDPWHGMAAGPRPVVTDPR